MKNYTCIVAGLLGTLSGSLVPLANDLGDKEIESPPLEVKRSVARGDDSFVIRKEETTTGEDAADSSGMSRNVSAKKFSRLLLMQPPESYLDEIFKVESEFSKLCNLSAAKVQVGSEILDGFWEEVGMVHSGRAELNSTVDGDEFVLVPALPKAVKEPLLKKLKDSLISEFGPAIGLVAWARVSRTNEMADFGSELKVTLRRQEGGDTMRQEGEVPEGEDTYSHHITVNHEEGSRSFSYPTATFPEGRRFSHLLNSEIRK